MGERVVFDLISGHNFQGKHLYFDNFFTSLRVLENLKLQSIKACGTIRPDRAGIPSDFVKKNRMQRGDCKSIITSNSILFIWMNTKHSFFASNYHKDNKIASISRRLQNGHRTRIACLTAIKDYNQFSHGIDLFNQRISCYNLDRKSKRNWLRIFIYFLNASIFNSFICYNQLAQDRDVAIPILPIPISMVLVGIGIGQYWYWLVLGIGVLVLILSIGYWGIGIGYWFWFWFWCWCWCWCWY